MTARKMSDPIDVVVFLSEAGETSIPLEVASAIDAEGIRIHVCSLFEPDDDTFNVDVTWLGATSQFDPRGYYRLYQFVRRVDGDVVHIHPNASGSVARCLLTFMDIALVSTEHNSHSHFGWIKRTVNGLTNALNEIVVANSETTKQSFAGWEQTLLSITGTEVQTIHNGVDIEGIEEGVMNGQPSSLPDGFCIGTAGRLVPQKNQAALIRAAAPLVKDREDVHLVFVGAGELESDLKTLAAERGIREKTHFLGYLPKRRDVYSVMAGFDIFAFPSKYEGFGVAVAEAMAAGVPVIVNDIHIFQEVVGDAGVLVDVNDIPTFTGALKALIKDMNRRQMLAAAGRERVERHFSLNQTVDQHVNLYKKIHESVSSLGND